jgi:hypothetical protein
VLSFRTVPDRDALTWRFVTRGPSGTHVLLFGDMIEGECLAPLRSNLEGPEAILDTAGVRRVNSMGVRELVELLEVAGGKARLVLERCSPAVVNQLNMLPELTYRAVVRSVLVPMECPRCFGEQEHLVDLANLSLLCHCDACGAEMDLAEPRDRYFAFHDDDRRARG